MCRHQCPSNPHRPWELCPGCQADRMMLDVEDHEFEMVVGGDPGGGAEATQAEWIEALMEGLIPVPV